MDTLHNELSQDHKWYERWHQMDSHEIIHWLTFILVAVVAWSTISSQVSDALFQFQNNNLAISVPKSQAVISLVPKTYSAKVGDTFSADIFLNTNAGPIDAVDIYALHYDPTILKVIDDVPSQKGVQILPTDLLPNTAVNIVDESTGTIKLGQFANGGTTFNGKGAIATIHFKALRAGSTYLKFDFSKGSTIDTNAAHRGKDKLTNVVDAIYTVTP